MQQRKVALIGFRATDKSTAGEILARDLGMEFIDMDKPLASEAGRDIATLIELARSNLGFCKIGILIKMGPMYRLPKRIEAHVKLCVFSLLIERVAELKCKQSWSQI
jgi:hypothetical protein